MGDWVGSGRSARRIHAGAGNGRGQEKDGATSGAQKNGGEVGGREQRTLEMMRGLLPTVVMEMELLRTLVAVRHSEMRCEMMMWN